MYGHLMAHIIKDRKSPYYQARFINQIGKLVQRSTKTKDRDRASNMASCWELEARAVREHQFPKSRYRVVRDVMYHMASGEAVTIPTVDAFFDAFIHESEVKLEDQTAASRKQTIRLFLSYLKETHENPHPN